MSDEQPAQQESVQGSPEPVLRSTATVPLDVQPESSAAQGPTFYSAPTVPVLHPASESDFPPSGPPQPSPRGRKEPDFKRLWLLTLVACLLLMLLSLGLLVYLLALLNARTGLVLTHLPTLTVTHAAGTSTAIQLSIFPASFSPANCIVDNGYRCTAILMAAGPAGTVHWQAHGEGVAARFNPSAALIQPGQQEQVIIYLSPTCPSAGQLIFSWDGGRLLVPWRC
jgi:hypothetical protein